MTSRRLLSLAAVVVATLALHTPATGETGATATTRTAEPVAARAGGADEALDRLRAARDRVFPALVSLHVVAANFRDGKEFKSQSVGSGAIISRQGHVVTNEHVTRAGRRFDCVLSDQRRVSARLVGEDPLTDLAVLQIELPEEELAQLPVADFGDSSALQIGDPVMAMGSPFALSRSVSLGIVSNTERVFAGGFGNDDLDDLEFGRGQRTGLYTRWIQHDALISPGNSGGPLVNMAGEIVGINELGGGNLSFAIPSNLAGEITEVLIERGDVDRSWFGLGLRPVDEETAIGALISAVELDGPGYEAGVRAGDLLVSVDGDPVHVQFVEQVPLLLDRLAHLAVGSEVKFGLLRRLGGEAREVEVRLTTRRLEKDVGDESSFHVWGLSGRDITPKMARDAGLDSSEGVVVTGVRAGGPGQKAEPKISRGDILRAIDGEKVASLDDLIALYDRLSAPGESRPLVVEVDRYGRRQLTVLEPSVEEPDDPPRELPKAWIGVATQPVFGELSRHLGLGDDRGYRITRVYPGTLAESAGLQVGDVLLSFEGVDLAPSGMEDAAVLTRLVRSRDIGSSALLEVFRGGETLALAVELERARLTPEEARRHSDTDFEFTVRELTFFDRDSNGWGAEVDGVMVENVDSGGWAGLAGLRPGDLLQSVDGQPVRGLRSLRAAMRTIRQTRTERVDMRVVRVRRSHYLEIEADWAPSDAAEDGTKQVDANPSNAARRGSR